MKASICVSFFALMLLSATVSGEDPDAKNIIANVESPDEESSEASCFMEHPSPKPYYGDFFFAVHHVYSQVHGYVSLVVCIIGVTVNIITIMILTR